MNNKYQVLFVLVALFCVYLFARRRVVDPILVGFVSSLIYFFPGFVGSIAFSYGSSVGGYNSPVVSGAFISMSIVLLVLTMVAVVFDRLFIGRSSVIEIPVPLLPYTLLAVALAGLLVSLYTVGKGYLCIEKNDVLARIDGWYYIAAYAAPLALISSLSVRAWPVVVVSGVIVLSDLFVGFRAGVSVVLIAFGLLFGGWVFQGRKKQIAFVVIILSAGASLFVVKQLAWNLKYAVSVSCDSVVLAPSSSSAVETAQSVAEKTTPPLVVEPIKVRSEQLKQLAGLLLDLDTYVAAFSHSEPMVTQSILNEVVDKGFEVPLDHIVMQALSGVPGGRSIFGIEVSGVSLFSDLFQRELFPLVKFGMASNPWAQAYSAGGYYMVALFALVYSGILAVLAWAFLRTRGSVQGAISVFVGWWGFYMHRNDVMTEIGIMKMVFYIFVVSLLFSLVFGVIFKYMNFSGGGRR